MGARLSISMYNDRDDEMRKVLLQLSKERFKEFREVVLNDRKLSLKFRACTQNREGDFFSSWFAAVGYMKDEVFFSKERTQLVYQHVQDYYNRVDSEWPEEEDSEDECQPQEEMEDTSDEENIQMIS